MIGVCINNTDSSVLQHGKKYFLFANGGSHVYVSNFNNIKAHFGCFKKEIFQIVDVTQELEIGPEPLKVSIVLDKDILYKANLIWRRLGYISTKLKHYYVKSSGKNHVYFFEDEQLTKFCGCFPKHWFSNFVEVQSIGENELPEPELLPIEKWQQLSLF